MRKSFLLIIVLCLAATVALSACSKAGADSDADKEYCYVNFLDWDGRLIQKNKCVVGEGVNAPVSPKREDDADYSYVFNGWDKSLEVFTEDTDVTAVYKENRLYKIILSLDGKQFYCEKQLLVKVLPIPEEEGKEFDGWYTDIYYNQKVNDSYLNSLYLENDATFYGRWYTADEIEERNSQGGEAE